MKRFLILTIGLILGFNCFTQKIIDDQQGSWWNYSGTYKINKKISLLTLYSWRRSDFIKNWQQSLARMGVNYKLADNFTVTPGYDWAVTFSYGKQPVPVKFSEHRAYEMFTLKNKINRVYVTHRYRFEQRFLENASLNADHQKITNGYRFRQRTRYRLTATIPINNKTMEDHTLFLSVFDEIFINFGKGVGKNVLDQNWFNASLGWQFNQQFKISLGYQNQFIIKGDGISIERNHILSIGIGYKMDLFDLF
jgi:outer membrane receptor protein involved in Fe transport